MSDIPSGTLPSGDTASRPTIRLQPSRHKRVQHGHPWVYSNEIHMDNTAKAIPPGSVVRVVTHDGAPLGTATFNPHTLICTRMLTRDFGAEIDRAFLAERLRRALELRERLFDRPFYRLIHAEADGLPALIVDRFGDVVVVQANSAGMERLTPTLLEALDEVLAPKAVVLRNDSPSRGLEGLGLMSGLRPALWKDRCGWRKTAPASSPIRGPAKRRAGSMISATTGRPSRRWRVAPT